MRVGAITNAFRCERWIDGCVRQFAGTGIDHLVLCNWVSWNGGLKNDQSTISASGLSGATVEIGSWASAQEQFNYGLSRFQGEGYDWVLLVDSDERWTALDLRILLRELEETKYVVARPSFEYVYWKTPDYRIEPQPGDLHYVAYRPHVRVENIRWPGAIPWMASKAALHHFSYVRTDEEMWNKLVANDDYKDTEWDLLEAWFREKWLGWTPETTNLHPKCPSQFARAVYDPAPLEVMDLIS